MRRRIVLIAVLLLAGAIVNVAVAWAIAARLDLAAVQPVYGLSHVESPRWRFERLDRFGSTRLWSKPFDEDKIDWTIGPKDEYHEVRQNEVPAWSRMRFPPLHSNESGVEQACGWPVISMYVMLVCFDNLQQSHGGIQLSWNPNCKDLARSPRGLPVTPLWPGFAINTIFYTAILWVIFFAPGKVRRAIRTRRGLCPACAYPVGTSPVCTECGKPVVKSSRDIHGVASDAAQ